jgi:hypothetical protein
MTTSILSERPAPDKIMARLTPRQAHRMRRATEALAYGRGYVRFVSLLLDQLLIIEEGGTQ